VSSTSAHVNVLESFGRTVALHPADLDELRDAANKVEAAVGASGLLDAIDVAAFFMSITRIVDADGHSNSTRATIMNTIVERALTSYCAIRRQKWLIALCLVAIGIAVYLRRY